MKILLFLLSTILFTPRSFSQEEVQFPSHTKVVTVPFKLLNNLIIIPLKINGADLNFLLDTGVEETILFSLEDQQEINLLNVERIKLRGLGSQNGTEGLRSSRNTISVGGLRFRNEEVLIVLDENMDFASSLGIPVNGIIGYRFFKDNLVKINYERKKIYIYNRERVEVSDIVKKFTPFPITIEKNKPYLQTTVTIDDEPVNAKLLVDTGNSDAIWLFHGKSEKLRVPERNLDEFLGRGFSGEIFGKKARIKHFAINGFKFKNPIVSFPDTSSIRNVKMVDNRLGSVGGELFKRFIVVFDYQNQKLYARKNGSFNLPFNYNKSGIELHHAGLRYVKEEIPDSDEGFVKVDFGDNRYNLKYRFDLKPSYEIASVRKDSPADQVGLMKGDVLVAINKSYCHYHTLQEINNILRSDEGKVLEIEIERQNKPMKFRLRLQNLL